MTLSSDRAGIVIVGGGIVGCALAYYLTEEGSSDTLVLEQSDLGSGSTAGSAGGVRQQFSTPLEIELSRRGLEFWRTAEGVFDWPVPFFEEGYLFLSGRDEIVAAFRDAAALQRAGGLPDVSVLEPAEVVEVAPWINAEGLAGGCYTPRDGRVMPSDGLAALVKAARSRGVRFREHCPVLGLERGVDGCAVRTAAGDVRAERVVVCAGYWTTQFMRPFGLNLTVKPVPMLYAITEPVGTDLNVPVTIDLDSGLFVERHGERLAVSVMYEENPVPYGPDELLDDIAAAAGTRAPMLLDLRIEQHTSGNVDRGGDGHPYVGEVEPGLWMAAGFGGHGTMHGPVVAQLLARTMAGRPDPTIDLSILDPWRPPGSASEWLVAAKKE